MIKKDIELKDLNWFKTGGKSKYFCSPKTEKDFIYALDFAKEKAIDIFTLGCGANILISDSGFDGLTIKPEILTLSCYENLVKAGAGVKIQDLINYCLSNNLIGLEEFSNIPGTIGGSVYINIHYFEFFLSDFLVEAKLINKKTGEIKIVDKQWFNFGYDKSKLQEQEYILIDATFKLKKVDNIQTAYVKGRSDEITRQRARRYPQSNTCGSFFRNFLPEELNKSNSKKIPYIAYYLDKIGIKGELQEGQAIVSEKHANMLVTLPGATSKDVINLARKIQKLVLDKFGLLPEAECQFIGFKEYPLIQI